MEVLQLFPPSLLNSSNDERLFYFTKTAIVDHPELRRAVTKLDESVNSLLDRRLILLVGPAGVGKSTALQQLIASRNRRRKSEQVVRPEIAPAVWVKAKAPRQGAFDFTDIFRSGLHTMNVPLPDRTVPLEQRLVGNQSIWTTSTHTVTRSMHARALEERFHMELASREVEIFGIDEAINIFETGRQNTAKNRSDALRRQTEKLKTMTECTRTPIVLVGAYDFFDLTLLSGQIARRTTIVHSEAYSATSRGVSEFMEALHGLLGHLPLRHQLRVSEVAAELFALSLGCIGLLKEILGSALSTSLSREVQLTLEHVREQAYPVAQLDKMRAEMLDGAVNVRRMLVLRSSDQRISSSEQVQEQQAPGIKKRRLKPGESKPSFNFPDTNTY